MPKEPKTAKVSTGRKSGAGISKSSSSKKKKVTSVKAFHAASLEADLHKLQNPGKLKAPRADKSKDKSTKAASAAETKLDNELLTAAATKQQQRKAKARLARSGLYGDGMDDGEEDDDDDDGRTEELAEEAAADDEEQMTRDEAAHISARMSKKILQQVHAQQKEEEDGEGEEEERQGANNSRKRLEQILTLSAAGGADELSDAESGVDENEMGEDGDEDVEEVELSAEDQASLEMFMPSAASSKGKSLADVIMEKIREKEAAQAGNGPAHGSNVKFGPGFGSAGGASSLASAFGVATPDMSALVQSKLDPKIVEVYQKVAKFLSHYTSGKIPKAFKLIPNLKSWEEILFLTNPEGWSCQAYFVATRIFASNFNPKMAQRFYSLILLPKIRNDIESNKHLNFHLYQSVKKSLYKPAAFFKGLLLPLAEEGASAREAVIFASILNKCTIPVLHSSVALLKLSQIPYSGTTSLFMKTLINKKYSLPRKVLNALVQYFCGFLHHSAGGAALGHMPLIWHQTLLCFMQRYKLELSENQVTAIRNLVKVQSHHGVSAEIRRELAAVAQQKQAMLAAGGPGFQFGAKQQQQQQVAAMGATTFGAPQTGFTSLAASMRNPAVFSMPQQQTTESKMEM